MDQYHALTNQREFEAYNYEAQGIVESYELGVFSPPDPDAQPLYDEYINNMYKTDKCFADMADHSEGSDRDFNPPLAASKYHIKLPIHGLCTPIFWGEPLPWTYPPPCKLEIKHVGCMVKEDKAFVRFVWLRKSDFHAIALVVLSEEMERRLFACIPPKVIIHPCVRNRIKLRHININYMDTANTVTINMVPHHVLHATLNRHKRIKIDHPE